jgi:integrase
MLHWAVDAGYVNTSPFPRRLLPRVPKKHPDVLTDEEVAVLTQLEDPYGFTIRLGLATGLRWSDLLRVERGHIRDGMLEVEIAKTGEARRFPLRPEIDAEIRNRIGPLVPFSPKSKGSFARTVRKLSGIERFHIHQMRHTAATNLRREGWGLDAVQEFLGHKSIVTTQRYARFSESMMRAEAERLWGGRGSERKTVAGR